MNDPFDKLMKRLATRALGTSGPVVVEHEVSPDAQAVDVWFQPDPARDAERLSRGLLGRMMAGPSMLEAFHDTPGVDDVRACTHKQLGLDRVRLAEARRLKQPRPAFPRLWLLSSGRPAGVIEGYGFEPLPGAPAGFFTRDPADAVGLVVIRELPRDRDTLLLRLMGAGDVLRAAILDLMLLPDDAWEREVAMNELIALRFEMPQDPVSQLEREYLMTTQDLEYWKRRFRDEGVQHGLEQGVRQGLEQGAKQGLEKGLAEGERHGLERGFKEALVTLFRSRFGEPPAAVLATIEGTHERATLDRWLAVMATASRADVLSALGSSLPA